jgi:hypothetical protein
MLNSACRGDILSEVAGCWPVLEELFVFFKMVSLMVIDEGVSARGWALP